MPGNGMAGFDRLFEFEKNLADFTGAEYAVVTDCCTHAIELCMRYDKVGYCEFPAQTYLSIPQLVRKLGISYAMTDTAWTGEYQFDNTRIWDSARRLEPRMYHTGQLQCLSFGQSKPLHLGRAGAVLTDDPDVYRTLSCWRSDGRDLTISPWQNQKEFEPGYHFCPTLEVCELGIERLKYFDGAITHHTYPDCREIIFL